MSERDELQDVLAGWTFGHSGVVEPADALEMADAILASDWLREHDKQIAREWEGS